MSYTSNPYVGKARKEATNWVKKGFSHTDVARMFGVHRSTIGRWMKKATKHSGEWIRTESSRPHRPAHQLPLSVVDRVVALRMQTGRCAQVIHAQLQKEAIAISLASVKRIIQRQHLTRRKKRHIKTDTRFRRPKAEQPGALVQMDTIHFVTTNYQRFYVYTVIDVYSRMAYAEYQPRIATGVSCGVVERALHSFRFPVTVIQTDNGIEFGDYFVWQLKEKHIRVRHTRVRKPNDNAHVERFIRTIQEECFDGVFPRIATVGNVLRRYLTYYNKERLHLGLQCKTPAEMLQRS